MRAPLKILFGILATALLFAACGPSRVAQRLVELDALIKQNPDSALMLLSSFSADTLSDADRNLLGLLRVKAADKAYIQHKSDSAINALIEYYSHHTDNPRYPEALYYGGRVNSDLGDYPTALRYYQEALDNLPEDKENYDLKGNILSQMARLFDKLRLYDKAIESLDIVKKLEFENKDSLNYLYDSELTGQVYLHAEEFDKAQEIFTNSIALAEQIQSDELKRLKMYLASTQYLKGNYSEALSLIRGLSYDGKNNRAIIPAHAMRIYYKLGIQDTAFLYARQLLNTNNPLNRKDAYEILLTADMQQYIPKDSLFFYIAEYNDIIENYLNENGSREALLQSNFYNYRNHENARIKAEEKKIKLERWLSLAVISLLLLLFILSYTRYRNRLRIFELKNQIRNFEALIYNVNRNNNSDNVYNFEGIIIENHSNNIKELKNNLRKRLLEFYSTHKDRAPLSRVISDSEAYKKLISDYVKTKKSIPASSPLWDELREVVNQASTKFDENLRLLYGDEMETLNYRIALLVKCGLTPTHLTYLINKTKGTLSYRRRQLCIKLLNEALGPKAFDDIIYLL